MISAGNQKTWVLTDILLRAGYSKVFHFLHIVQFGVSVEISIKAQVSMSKKQKGCKSEW